jgi:hypothetical protein
MKSTSQADFIASNLTPFNREKMMDRRAQANDEQQPQDSEDGTEDPIQDGLATEPRYASQQSPQQRVGSTTQQPQTNQQALPQQGAPSQESGEQSPQQPGKGLSMNARPYEPRQRSTFNRAFNNIRFGKEQKQAYTRIKQLREANKKLEKKLDPIQKQLRPLEALKLLEETKRTSLIVWCAVLCLAGSMLMITIFLFEIGLILFGIAGRILLLISRASLKIKKLKKQMEPLEKTRSQIRTKQDENEKKIKQEELQIQIIKNRSFLSTQRSRAKEQQPT